MWHFGISYLFVLVPDTGNGKSLDKDQHRQSAPHGRAGEGSRLVTVKSKGNIQEVPVFHSPRRELTLLSAVS